MTTLRKAAKKALEALDRSDYFGWQSNIPIIKSLREALAEPEPEPVAWMDRDGDIYPMPETEGWRPPHKLLYTHPPQHQEANPVVWQFRMRPDWVLDKDFWEPWTNCTKEQAADYQRVPHLHDWKYEVRLLFTHPPQRKPLTVEQLRDIKEHQRLLEELGPVWAPMLYYFCQAIERAHGIGGEE